MVTTRCVEVKVEGGVVTQLQPSTAWQDWAEQCRYIVRDAEPLVPRLRGWGNWTTLMVATDRQTGDARYYLIGPAGKSHAEQVADLAANFDTIYGFLDWDRGAAAEKLFPNSDEEYVESWKSLTSRQFWCRLDANNRRRVVEMALERPRYIRAQ